MEHSFKKIVLAEHQRLWLQEVFKEPNADLKKIKVKLWTQMPKGFDPNKIDRRLYLNDHLTLIGIWTLDPSNKVFEAADNILNYIRQKIIEGSDLTTIAAKNLSESLGMDELYVEKCLYLISEMGLFFTGAHTTNRMDDNGLRYSSFNLDGKDAYDSYLSFSGIENLMEEYYTSRTADGSTSSRNVLSEIQGLSFYNENKPVRRECLLPKDIPQPKKNSYFSDKFCVFFFELQNALKFPDHEIAISICFRTFLELLTDTYLKKNEILTDKALAGRLQLAFSDMDQKRKMADHTRAFINKISNDNEYFSINTLHKVAHRHFYISESDLRGYVNNLEDFIRHAIDDVNLASDSAGNPT